MFRDEKTGLIPSIHEGLMDLAANVLYQVLFSYLFFFWLIVTNQILGCMCFLDLCTFGSGTSCLIPYTF